MPRNQKKGGRSDQRWIQKSSSSKTDGSPDATYVNSAFTEAITNGINKLAIAENSARSSVPMPQFGSITLNDVAPLHVLNLHLM
ncbi:hypothetical protein L2E82_10830 [Cichorium intybus]|uniref:Uncharacterized protein n=1 Tax=Cichorium intybus TaxID=13427 RepID=A0ACB9GDM7_CICIN|nr:hypothetical protein L2E82_10830 [Cichorium intybus]